MEKQGTMGTFHAECIAFSHLRRFLSWTEDMKLVKGIDVSCRYLSSMLNPLSLQTSASVPIITSQQHLHNHQTAQGSPKCSSRFLPSSCWSASQVPKYEMPVEPRKAYDLYT